MSDVPRQLPPKKEVALALLEGPSVFVHLDPRREGVVVPKWFLGQPQLVLQVGLNMTIPIPDLRVDEDGVSCTLSFSRTPFWCSIPWSAVYALVGEDGRGMVWPNDVPPEVALQMQQKAAPPPGKQAKKTRKLAAVDASEPSEAESARGTGRGRARQEPKADEAAAEKELTPVPARVRPSDRPEPAAARSAERGPRAPEARPASASAEEKRDVGAGRAKPRPAPAASETKKPKRELPPYLRVIK